MSHGPVRTRPLKVAWLATYPVQQLAPALALARRPDGAHPSSWIVNLSRALAQRDDVELHLITLSQYVPASQTVAQGMITFHVIRSAVPFTHRGYPPWWQWDVLTGFRADRRRLRRVLAQIEPDLVHGHGTEGPYALAAAQSGRPAVVSMQGIIAEIGRLHPVFRYRRVAGLEAAAVRQARFFTCRTAYDTGFVRTLNPTARIFTIHEAVNPVFFSSDKPSAGAPMLLFVGSLVPWKGLDLLVEALAMVRRACPDVSLRVVGTGSDAAQKHYRQLIEQRGLAQAVEFLGFQPAAEIARLHREAQIFVLPSQNDNSPNALAEAMVSGLPVIATRVGGIPSMVEDGTTGLLVPWGDPQALAAKILWLLQQPAERQRLAANARRVARERHLPENVACATIVAYKEVLQQERTHEYFGNSHRS